MSWRSRVCFIMMVLGAMTSLASAQGGQIGVGPHARVGGPMLAGTPHAPRVIVHPVHGT
jgi:hypothetical protein